MDQVAEAVLGCAGPAGTLGRTVGWTLQGATSRGFWAGSHPDRV